jgi:hypothetical protein
MSVSATTLEISKEVMKKLKIDLPYYSAKPFLGIQPKEGKSTYKRYLHTHVYSSTIHSNQAMESASVPSNQ